MKLHKDLLDDDSKPALRRFANLKKINKKLDDLSRLAEPEKWTIYHQKNDLLYNYIFCIFDLALKQDLVYVNEDDTLALFNTGLLTVNGQDIYGRFVRNADTETSQKWSLEGFYKDSNRTMMSGFSIFPDFIEHFEKQEDAYYDCSLELRKELDHIIDDNFDRLPLGLQTIDAQTLRYVVNGSIDTSLKKVKRNNRLVAPQLYFGKITYLLPIDMLGQKYALAVEKINNQYRANTILTIDMAYMQARLVMKPESNWLLPNAEE